MLSTQYETAGGSGSTAHHLTMMRTVACFLTLACMIGCVSSTQVSMSPDGGSWDAADGLSIPTDTGAGDAGTTTTDAVGIDVDEGGCEAEFIAGQFAPVGRTSGRFCLPLPNGVTVTHSNCRPLAVSVGVQGSLLVTAGGAPDMFTAAGPTMIGSTIFGRGLPCAAAADACQFRTIGAPCAATVVRSGGLNQLVEVALQGPCVLRQYDDVGNALAEINLVSFRMRGTLRLFVDASTRSDGAVVDACE